jgi:hypothetical protein
MSSARVETLEEFYLSLMKRKQAAERERESECWEFTGNERCNCSGLIADGGALCLLPLLPRLKR